MKEKRIEKSFFEYVSSVICETGLESGDMQPKELSSLYNLAKSHDLAHLVAEGLDRNGLLKEDEISQAFSRQRVTAVCRYEQIQYEFEEICRIFETEKIPFMPLKGAILREYYPQPWLRTSCDIDILVHKEQAKKIVALLTEKYDYRYSISTQHDHSLYTLGGVHIELHFELIVYSKKCKDVAERVWETATLKEGTEYRYEMTEGHFFAYHIAHMAQHVATGGGCGVKPFIDLWIMQNKMKLPTAAGMELLETYGLKTFAEKALALTEYWFGNAEGEPTLFAFEKFILRGGVYGTLGNKVRIGKSLKKGKFRYLLSRLFLPYRTLALLYPSLKKCPILFPFYQIRRWFRLLLPNGYGMKKAVCELRSASDGGDEEELLRLIKDLGLE